MYFSGSVSFSRFLFLNEYTKGIITAIETRQLKLIITVVTRLLLSVTERRTTRYEKINSVEDLFVVRRTIASSKIVIQR